MSTYLHKTIIKIKTTQIACAFYKLMVIPVYNTCDWSSNFKPSYGIYFEPAK